MLEIYNKYVFFAWQPLEKSYVLFALWGDREWVC